MKRIVILILVGVVLIATQPNQANPNPKRNTAAYNKRKEKKSERINKRMMKKKGYYKKKGLFGRKKNKNKYSARK